MDKGSLLRVPGGRITNNGFELAQTGPGKLVIVEDETDFRELLTRRAHKMGLEVQAAPDGRTAHQALSRGEIDVLVVDIHLPDISGLEILRRAHEADPDISAIVITAAGSLETVVSAMRLGAVDFLTKPLNNVLEFDAAVLKALERTRLIRENARLLARTKQMAVRDPLTGLYNRRMFDQVLKSELHRAVRYDLALALVVLDLDGLKSINDVYGHQTGDESLKAVARIIKMRCRVSDTAARLGGDEFVLLLPGADSGDACATANRILEDLSGERLEGFVLAASAGVSCVGEAICTPETLLSTADMALYQAKSGGGRKVVANRR